MEGHSKLKTLLLIGSFLSSPFFLMIFTLFVVVLFVVGAFDGDGSGSTASTKVCGFNISGTILSQSDYKQKIEELAATNSKFQIFADESDAIYKYAKEKNINPELVVIRAYAEGQGDTTGTNNYWGIGCTNGDGLAACHSYDTFEEGYISYIDLISQYDSLESMMQRYAYIGDYWYNPGSSADGGCYYAKYIYGDNIPSRVQNACSASAPQCTTSGGSGCTKTTEEDQNAYATWQVKSNMGGIRQQIFGLEYNQGTCVGGTLGTLTNYTLKHDGLAQLTTTLTSDEISSLNNYISSEVNKAGHGTGEAVAAAGQALAYWLEKEKGSYLAYYYGGGHGEPNLIGASLNWGASYPGDHLGRTIYGMDCSAFVSWAIRNACTPSYGSKTTHFMNHGNQISVNEAKPGDIHLDLDSHVRLVIKNNDDGTVIVAEESGGSNGLIFNQVGEETGYSFIDMSEYYANNCDK